MKIRAAVMAAVMVGAAASALCQDVVAIAPQDAKVLYEDARVRVVRLRVPPNEALPVHDRPARVVIPLVTSDVHMTRADGSVGTVRSTAGKAGWSGPGRRSFVNLADPIDNVIVEIKDVNEPAKALAQPPTPRPANYLSEPHHHWQFENQYVRVYDVRIPPGETTEYHLHALDTVSVVIAGAKLESQTERKPWGKPAEVSAGEVTYSADAKKPRTHRVHNVGNSEYHVILVQLLR